MDTKWKNKISAAVWLLLTAYGISGILLAWDEAYSFLNQDSVFWIYLAGAITSLLASVILGRNNDFLSDIAPRKRRPVYNKIPLDTAVILFAVTALAAFGGFLVNDFLDYAGLFEVVEGVVIHLVITTVLLWLVLVQGIYLFRRLNDVSSLREDWSRSVMARFVRMNRNAFLNRKVGTQVFLLLSIVFLLGLFLGLGAAEEAFIVMFTFAFFIIGIPLFILILKRVGYFNRILINANALASGQFEPELEIKGKSVLAKLALDLNRMKYGVKISQNAQAKSERLKTELITNVSHDLRTPLTSIMTYSELLKGADLTEDERDSYVEIIDRKSKRLKVLIEDLFEASKMASGNIEIEREKVDIVQLLQQALAEYSETIEESSVQLRISSPDQPLYAFVDGQKIWRVFENLIGNILKYSLPNTRAYIQIREVDEQAIITFKNISEYELNGNIDELTERFKRGDESRHTEGSGLGLAIASSIVDLHGGSMDIEADGDLFKVTVTIGLLG